MIAPAPKKSPRAPYTGFVKRGEHRYIVRVNKLDDLLEAIYDVLVWVADPELNIRMYEAMMMMAQLARTIELNEDWGEV